MNVTLDENIAKTLRQTTLKRYGKLRGASRIIEEALRRYFEQEGITIEENATA
jgi:Arc/MetJ family transcription regulator